MNGCCPRSTPPSRRGHDVARISDETRRDNESAIRQVMDRLLAGEIPARSKCDIKTLAAQAGVARTGLLPQEEPRRLATAGALPAPGGGVRTPTGRAPRAGSRPGPRGPPKSNASRNRSPGSRSASPHATRRSTALPTSGSESSPSSPPSGWRSSGCARSWPRRRMSGPCRTVHERMLRMDRIADRGQPRSPPCLVSSLQRSSGSAVVAVGQEFDYAGFPGPQSGPRCGDLLATSDTGR